MNDAAYEPRVVLLTGGAGFIGSHVARRLVERYPSTLRVVVLDKLDYCSSLENLRAVADRPNFRFVRGDVQSMDLLCHLLDSEDVDTVLHFAAQTHVDSSFGNSLEFTRNNTLGTHVLLEACRLHGPRLRRFVNVSTDEVYGDTSVGVRDGLAETAILEPTNPYSAAKAGAEMMCKAYVTSYRMPILVTRGNNVYGPGQFPEKLVPRFALLALRGDPLPIHGEGLAVRSYLHVDDVAAAFDCVLHHGRVGETYNVGAAPGEERSVLRVAADVHAATRAARAASAASATSTGDAATSAAADIPPRVLHVADRTFNDRRYHIGSEKLNALGWTQTIGWEEGLRSTVEWYASIDPEAWWDPLQVRAALIL